MAVREVELCFLDVDGEEIDLMRRTPGTYTIHPGGVVLEFGVLVDPEDISWISIQLARP